MTRAEATRMRRLELQNAELRAQLDRQLEIYRDQAWELVQLRCERELIREIMGCADTTGSTPTA